MTNVSEWSVTAGLNNASPPDGWPEGMARSAVNDAAREMMASLARWYKDGLGTLTTGGGTTAYTLTTNSVHAALSDIPMLALRANATNTGACTLSVDGLSAQSLTKSGGVALSAGDFATGRVYVVIYDATGTRFEIVNTLSTDTFPAGTTTTFQQTSAPTGWTKGATHNNKALRLVTGTASTGGSTSFTSVFSSRSIGQANLPSVNFTLSATAASHSHGAGTFAAGSHSHGAGTFSVSTSIDNGGFVVRNPSLTTFTASDGAGRTNVPYNTGTATLGLSDGTVVGSSSASTPSFSGTSAASGAIAVSGTAASGGSGTALDFAVQYVDVILATRN